MLDVDKMAEVLLAGTRALIAKEIGKLRADNERLAQENTALTKRIDALEAIEAPEPVVIPDVGAMIADAIAAIPASDPVVLPDFAKMISDATPAPIPGKDADMAAVEKMVRDAVAAIPAPVIPAPIPGKDGLSIAEVKQNADGELIVKMSNGETINAGVVRGAAGIGFDDMAAEHDGERGLVLRFQRGEVRKEFAFEIPALIDRGVWTDGSFSKGDAVTWGGSLWIAQSATEEKPGEGKSWRLAVKKGRDAKPLVEAR